MELLVKAGRYVNSYCKLRYHGITLQVEKGCFNVIIAFVIDAARSPPSHTLLTKVWHHFFNTPFVFKMILQGFSTLYVSGNWFWIARTHWNVNIALWSQGNSSVSCLCSIMQVTCGGSSRWCQAWMRLSMMPSPNNPASTVSVTTKDTLRKTKHWSEKHEHEHKFQMCACRSDAKWFWYQFYLCGMSFGTSISRDFIWRILMLPSIPLAVTTSQANSYMVLDSSQAYTSAAPAFLAHILNRENQKIRTIIHNTGPILAIAKRINWVWVWGDKDCVIIYK